MNWLVEIVLYLLLVTTALLSLSVKDLVAGAAAATAFTFTMALLFISMGAIDVGFTEAVVGAGIVGVYFFAAIYQTSRRTRD